MAKADQEAFNTIVSLINSGKVVQFRNLGNKYTITVWPAYDTNINHSHYDGNSLIDAISKIK